MRKRVLAAAALLTAVLMTPLDAARAMPMLVQLRGTIESITNPFNSGIADHLSVGDSVQYAFIFDVDEDGFFEGAGGLRRYYVDESNVPVSGGLALLSRDWYRADLVGQLYLEGDFPLVEYHYAVNEVLAFPDTGRFDAEGNVNVGNRLTSSNLSLSRNSPETMGQADTSAFVSNWRVGDDAFWREGATHSGAVPGRPYQTSIEGRATVISVSPYAISEPSTLAILGLALATLAASRRGKQT